MDTKRMNQWKFVATAAMAGVSIFACVQTKADPMAGPTTAPAMIHDRPKPVAIAGEVSGYNLDPRGNYNGINLKDGDHAIQLNAPPQMGAMLMGAAPIGQKIQATGIPESEVGDRSIYRLISITSTSGQVMTLPGGPDSKKTMHVDGTVKQLNYTPRGEVDGAILDDGDFVHIDPRSAATLKLAVGQKLSVDGEASPMLSGHNAVDATKVNDTDIDHPSRPSHDGMGGPRGQHGPPDGGPMDGPPRGGPHGNRPPHPDAGEEGLPPDGK